MKLLWLVLLSVLLASPGYAQRFLVDLPRPTMAVQILSDTNGVDLGPYMRGLVSDLRSQWLPSVAHRLVPEHGQTIVSLIIESNGDIASIGLEHSAQDTEFDQAALNAMKATHYSPLPIEMKDPQLKLRVVFRD